MRAAWTGLGLLIAPLIGCGSERAPAATTAAQAVPVRTARVIQRDFDEQLTWTGTLRPRAQVRVVAEVAARLIEVLEDEGARVARGATLARLDDTDYRLAYQRAQAALAVAEANKAHALVEEERAQNLLQTGGITDKDRLAAQVSLQVAEASLAQVRADVAIASQQLARCELKAPFDGRVAERLVDPGAMLAGGTAVLVLVDDAVLEFRAAVPSVHYGRARVGDPVEVTADARPDLVVRGRVARIVPLVDERTRAFDVVVEVAGRSGLIGGMFARAQVRIGRVRDALLVPPAALIREGAAAGAAAAFVVVEGKAERRELALGIESAQAVEVKHGLTAGDRIVLDPPVSLAAGTPVQIHNGG